MATNTVADIVTLHTSSIPVTKAPTIDVVYLVHESIDLEQLALTESKLDALTPEGKVNKSTTFPSTTSAIIKASNLIPGDYVTIGYQPSTTGSGRDRITFTGTVTILPYPTVVYTDIEIPYGAEIITPKPTITENWEIVGTPTITSVSGITISSTGRVTISAAAKAIHKVVITTIVGSTNNNSNAEATITDIVTIAIGITIDNNLEVSSLTRNTLIKSDGTVTGDGIFDKLMESMNMHLKAQWLDSSITSTDRATIYVGSIQAVMQGAIQFALEKDLADENERTKKAEADFYEQKIITEWAQTEQSEKIAPTVTSIVGLDDAIKKNQKLAFEWDAQTKKLKLVTDTLAVSAQQVGEPVTGFPIFNKVKGALGVPDGTMCTGGTSTGAETTESSCIATGGVWNPNAGDFTGAECANDVITDLFSKIGKVT